MILTHQWVLHAMDFTSAVLACPVCKGTVLVQRGEAFETGPCLPEGFRIAPLLDMFVSGKPVGQPRSWKAAATAQREAHTFEAPDEHAIHGWKLLIYHRTQEALTGRPPTELPVVARLDFAFPRTGADWADGFWPCWKKPDIDNLEKAVYDALSKRAWNDDKLVFAAPLMKRIAAVGETPGVRVQLWEVTVPEKPKKRKSPAGR